MSDAPGKIWVAGTPQECGQYFPSCVEAEGAWGGVGVQYIRADAPELVAVLDALRRSAQFVEGPGDRPGPVLRQISAALAAFDALVKG